DLRAGSGAKNNRDFLSGVKGRRLGSAEFRAVRNDELGSDRPGPILQCSGDTGIAITHVVSASDRLLRVRLEEMQPEIRKHSRSSFERLRLKESIQHGRGASRFQRSCHSLTRTDYRSYSKIRGQIFNHAGVLRIR